MAVCAKCKGIVEDECPRPSCQEADWRIAQKYAKHNGGTPTSPHKLDPHAKPRKHAWPKNFDKDAKPPEIGAGRN